MLDHIVVTMALDTAAAFVAFVMPFVNLLTSSPMVWHEKT
jgi:hypothetical protein